jgi:hypothetical protein
MVIATSASMAAKGSRRKRPQESPFNSADLTQKWTELATLRSPGFSWDGTGYMSSRSQAIDEESMLTYLEPMLKLLEVAPTGFPAHKSLLATFEALHSKHAILNCDSRFVLRVASMAADNWRVMAKHIYNAALAKKR